jgi:uncharacterized membrane protein
MMTITAFLGFVVENAWLAVTKGYIDNRNMNLPFLLGYGIAIVGTYFLIGTPKDSPMLDRVTFLDTPFKRVVLYFLCSFVLVSLGEILLGTLVEKTCHIVWWNYSRIALHITKYTSVPTSTGFATIITFFMDKCFDPIMLKLSEMDYETSKKVSVVFLGLMVFDFLVNARKVYKNQDFNVTWKLELKKPQEDTEALV